MIEIHRDAGLSALVHHRATVDTLADGFQFTEGPLWCPDGSILIQDIKAEATYRIRPGLPPELVRKETRAANGQTFSRDGRILFCEQNGRRLSRMHRDGSGVETIAETWSGKRLNSPNDMVCGSDGLVYFTDPPYGVAPADRALHFQGVYAIDPEKGEEPRLLLDDFEKPNGIALTLDDRTLYVCDTARYHIRAFAVEPDGGLKPGSGRVFAMLDPAQPGGPDGLKVDLEGRVYAAAAEGVWVFEASGALLGIIALPKRPANLAWCERDGSRLVMTAVDTVYSLRLNVKGLLPLFTPSGA